MPGAPRGSRRAMFINLIAIALLVFILGLVAVTLYGYWLL